MINSHDYKRDNSMYQDNKIPKKLTLIFSFLCLTITLNVSSLCLLKSGMGNSLDIIKKHGNKVFFIGAAYKLAMGLCYLQKITTLNDILDIQNGERQDAYRRLAQLNIEIAAKEQEYDNLNDDLRKQEEEHGTGRAADLKWHLIELHNRVAECSYAGKFTVTDCISLAFTGKPPQHIQNKIIGSSYMVQGLGLMLLGYLYGATFK